MYGNANSICEEYNKSPCREGSPRLLKDKTHLTTSPSGIFSRDRAEKRLRMRHSSVNGNVGSGARGLKWLRFASKLHFGIQT